ncbi:MAG: GvpL/GvpF family gas vesicle protein [Deltaproteobacteria bacterium]|nr:GvpL/GvpF family gas vesicle protein [Deltaproteobacteria bacterium]
MQEEGLGLYLYCLYAGGNSLSVRGTETGIPDLVGIDGDHKVFTLSKGDIHAALSLVPLQEFDAGPLEQRMGDLEWVAPRVLIHERIIEEIMAAYPVMPLRFCTIFAATDRIEELLEIHHAKITRFLSDITDKEEWGVKGYIKGGRLGEALETLSPALRANEVNLREASLPVRGTQTGPGQAYLLRKKMALAVKDGLDSVVAQITEEVFQGLLVHAVKGIRTKTLQVEDGEERREMALNAALLVPRSDVKSFLGCVKETEERYRSHGLSLSVTGPWPPYNFCPVFGDEIAQG